MWQPVLTITFNRASRLNALTEVMLDEIITALNLADADDFGTREARSAGLVNKLTSPENLLPRAYGIARVGVASFLDRRPANFSLKASTDMPSFSWFEMPD